MALIKVSGIITPTSKRYSWVYMGKSFSRLVKKLIFWHRLKLNNEKDFLWDFFGVLWFAFVMEGLWFCKILRCNLLQLRTSEGISCRI